MRYVIAAASFVTPLMLVIAIGSCFADPPQAGSGGRPAMAPERMDELYRFTQAHTDLLDHYAAGPGSEAGTPVPHLSLERFSSRGSDAQGRPWYSLAQPPAPGRTGGVLRRAADDSNAIAAIDGCTVVVLSPLAGRWWYWEGEPKAGTAAKSP